MSIALSILDAVVKEIDLRREGSPRGRVPSLTVRLGSLSGVDREALSFAWDAAREEGPFPEAELIVEIRPARASCRECGRPFELGRGEGCCPRCGQGAFDLLEGREVELSRIVWEPGPDEGKPMEGA